MNCECTCEPTTLDNNTTLTVKMHITNDIVHDIYVRQNKIMRHFFNKSNNDSDNEKAIDCFNDSIDDSLDILKNISELQNEFMDRIGIQ